VVPDADVPVAPAAAANPPPARKPARVIPVAQRATRPCSPVNMFVMLPMVRPGPGTTSGGGWADAASNRRKRTAKLAGSWDACLVRLFATSIAKNINRIMVVTVRDSQFMCETKS